MGKLFSFVPPEIVKFLERKTLSVLEANVTVICHLSLDEVKR